MPPSRLGLVFDCTCPDLGRWRSARDLLYDPSSLDSDPPPRDYNADIRRALADALAALPAGPRVHLVSFGDCPGLGLPNIEGIEAVEAHTPLTGHSDLGEHPAPDLARPLAGCLYCSGLDLWDPLEEALRCVVHAAARLPAAGQAVLVVGNSPPTLPLAGDSPFRRLLTFQGESSGVRRRNALFTDAVADLKRLAIPAAYLFLTHDADPATIQRYGDMQRQVRDALAAYMPVVAAPADADGVRRGVAEAWALLSGPAPGSPS